MPGVEQRQIKRVDQNEAKARQEIERERQGRGRPGPAHALNREIAVVEPERHRDEDETRRAETGAERVDEFGERQDAAAADQPLRLNGEGDEGAEGDKPKQAKEQERDKLVARRLRVPSPQHEAQAEEGPAAPGDEGVRKLGDEREAGQMSIESEPKSPAPRLREREETGLRRSRGARRAR